jgi:hypothetical protein
MRKLTLIVLMLLAGCTTTKPATTGGDKLVIRDASGAVIASGELELPKSIPAAGQTFEGKWRLTSSTDAFPAGATKSGMYRGSVSEGGGISIDLNPGAADNNVILSGKREEGGLKGQWYHSTFVGRRGMGSFTVGGDGR